MKLLHLSDLHLGKRVNGFSMLEDQRVILTQIVDLAEEEKVDDSSMSTMQEMSEDIYIVEKGDTLAKISKKVYGDSGHVDAICRMNGLSDGNLIFIGQKLILP